MNKNIETDSIYDLIAKTSLSMKKQFKRDGKKKFPQWYEDLQQELTNCHDQASTKKIIKNFIQRYR